MSDILNYALRAAVAQSDLAAKLAALSPEQLAQLVAAARLVIETAAPFTTASSALSEPPAPPRGKPGRKPRRRDLLD